MKKILGFMLLLLFWGCTKEEVEIPKKLDLNDTFSGKVTGLATPNYFNTTAIWTISHQENVITAKISYENLVGFDMVNFKGTIENDTILVGYLKNSIGNFELSGTGKVSKDGNRITYSTVRDNHVNAAFDLTRK